MIIYLKNKHTLEVDDFKFRCSIGKNGKSKKKKEGDKKTPIGYFKIENLYYRSDRIKKPSTKLKCIKIKKNINPNKAVIIRFFVLFVISISNETLDKLNS